MKLLIFLLCVLSFGVAAAITVAGPGVRLGLWDYKTGLGTLHVMKYPAIVLSIASGIVLIVAVLTGATGAKALLFAAFVAGVAAVVPIKVGQLVATNPPIHDITTDFVDPPMITAGAAQPRKNPARYVGADKAPRSDLTIAEAQRAAFPEVKPLVFEMKIADAEARVRSALAEMGMEILSAESNKNTMVFEATDKSFWFGFTDDFVVRLAQEGQNTRIDIRSKSRVGVSDLGTNAQRILKFLRKIKYFTLPFVTRAAAL